MRHRWLALGLLALAVGLFSFDPASAQPGKGGFGKGGFGKGFGGPGKGKGGWPGKEEKAGPEEVKKLEAELDELKAKVKVVEAKLARAKFRSERTEKAPAPKEEKRGFGKGPFGGKGKFEKKADPKADRSSDIEKKLDQMQRDLDELKRSLRKR